MTPPLAPLLFFGQKFLQNFYAVIRLYFSSLHELINQNCIVTLDALIPDFYDKIAARS